MKFKWYFSNTMHFGSGSIVPTKLCNRIRLKTLILSFPRKRESIAWLCCPIKGWIPAFAGMTLNRAAGIIVIVSILHLVAPPCFAQEEVESLQKDLSRLVSDSALSNATIGIA